MTTSPNDGSTSMNEPSMNEPSMNEPSPAGDLRHDPLLARLRAADPTTPPSLPSADDPSTAHQIVPHWPPHVPPGGYHAIVVPAGGQAVDGPPAHVAARLEEAIRLYERSPVPKPFVITTAWGTPHKPCPHDAGGFERHPASDDGAGRAASSAC